MTKRNPKSVAPLVKTTTVAANTGINISTLKEQGIDTRLSTSDLLDIVVSKVAEKKVQEYNALQAKVYDLLFTCPLVYIFKGIKGLLKTKGLELQISNNEFDVFSCFESDASIKAFKAAFPTIRDLSEKSYEINSIRISFQKKQGKDKNRLYNENPWAFTNTTKFQEGEKFKVEPFILPQFLAFVVDETALKNCTSVNVEFAISVKYSSTNTQKEVSSNITLQENIHSQISMFFSKPFKSKYLLAWQQSFIKARKDVQDFLANNFTVANAGQNSYVLNTNVLAKKAKLSINKEVLKSNGGNLAASLEKMFDITL